MERTNESQSGYTYNGQQYQKQNRTDSQGNTYTVDVASSAIPASTLNSQTRAFSTPTPAPATNYNQMTADVTNPYVEKQTQSNLEMQSSPTGDALAIQNLMNQASGKNAYEGQQAQSLGLNSANEAYITKQAELTSLAKQAAAAQQENIAQGRQLGSVGSFVAGQGNEIERNRAIKALTIGAELDAIKGNIDVARMKVQQAVDAKYAGIEQDLANRKSMFDINAKVRESLSKEEQKTYDRAQDALVRKDKETALQKADEKDLQSLSLTIAKNGAPARVQEIIKNAKDFNEAVIAATPYLQSATDKAELSYKLAQTSKIYADMRNDAATVGSNVAPENMLPFSQEYAATGKIPLGAPKGSQASIMRYAKELPQSPGSMVSSITGVKNTSLGVAQQDDITRLYNITQSVKDLKKLDEKRIGGISGGTVGKVFGSDAQGDYLAKRKSIVDDISRMQSGAALTPDEVKFYEDYLPGRFSETLGLGRDSYKKIATFEKLMNEKLNNTLKNNQLSVYGYSKVTPPGSDTEYTVGDLIQVNGVTGRINPDGTVTVIE